MANAANGYSNGQHQQQNGSSSAQGRSSDYVVFTREPTQMFSRTSVEKATAAKLKLEHFYKKAVDDVVERNQR